LDDADVGASAADSGAAVNELTDPVGSPSVYLELDDLESATK